MPAELGILLVHGIGSQKRGETIANMGDSLYRALKNWIEATSTITGGKVEIVDAVLRPKGRSTPAHVRLSISTDHDSEPVEWIMAECHWANSFPPPDHRTVTIWLMRVVPWIWISFFARRLLMAAAAIKAAMRASPRRWLEAGRLCISLLVAPIVLPLISPLVLALELCLVALLIAGLVPLGIVHDFVARITALISAILGDSFIYASSAVRQQAVISKIRADLAWLESRGCRHLVILGHSQGAALSYLSLRQDFPTKVRLLITFGSGLHKLHHLKDERKWWIGLFDVLVIFSATGFLLTVATWLGLYTYSSPFAQQVFIWVQTAMAFLYSVIPIFFGLRERTDDIRHQASEYARHRLKWIDAYASMDPVPNGPLFLVNVPFLESIEVCNESSLIRDHTSYANNTDEFLLMIIRAIGQHSGTELRIADLTPRDEAVQAYAKQFRRIRRASYKIDEYILFAALVGFLFNLEAMKLVGTWLNEWINAVCDSAGFASCWERSPVASGLLVTMVGYVFLRMGIQAMASLWDDAAVQGVYSRASVIDRSPPLYSHGIAGITLSWVALLYYPQTFSWAEWLHQLQPSGSLSFPVRLTQGSCLGIVFTFALWIVFNARISRLDAKKRGREPGGVDVKETNAKDSEGSSSGI